MADAEATLTTLLREIADAQQYKNYDLQLKAFNTGGANYTSVLFYITVSAPGKEDLKLFAKVASVGEKFRSMGYVDRMYVSEQEFYNAVMKVWNGLQEKYDIADIDRYVFPKFYGGNPEFGKETVVLENLIAQGYNTYNRFKGVDWEYAAKAIEILAKFHALSFIHQKANPDEYEKIAEKLKFESPPDDEAISELWAKMIEQPIQVLDEEGQKKVRNFFNGVNLKDLYLKYNTPRKHKILIHGDYRPSNLLHKEHNGHLFVIPVDYQTVHTGCPVIDLIYFISLATDVGFRARHWDRLLAHYYQQLSLALTRFKMDPTEIYPKEEFDEDLKEMFPYALLVGVMVLPVVTVESENAPQMSDDTDIDAFVLKPNEIFADRFAGLVRDLIKRDII